MATSEETRARKKLMITGGAIRRDRRKRDSLTALIRRLIPGSTPREKAIKERRGLNKRISRREKRYAEQRKTLENIRALDFDGSPTGMGSFDGYRVLNWIIPYLIYGRAHGWDGVVTSGYRSEADQYRVCNSPPYPRPCAAPGHSRHQGIAFPNGAVDVSRPYELEAVIANIPNRVLFNAGHVDPPHFSTGSHEGMSGY